MYVREEKRKRKRARRINRKLQEYTETKISSTDVSKIGTQVCQSLLLPPASTYAVRQTILGLAGRYLSEEELEFLSYQMSFGRERLKEKKPLGEKFFSREQMEARCVKAEMTRPAKLHFRFLEGALSWQVKSRPCSPSFLQWLGYKSGLKGRHYRDFHPREFVGLGFIVDVCKDNEDRLRLNEFEIPDRLKRKNTQLRLDRKGSDCDVACTLCPRSREDCKLSTHPLPWKSDECENGHEAYHNSQGCVLCQEVLYRRWAKIESFEKIE